MVNNIFLSQCKGLVMNKLFLVIIVSMFLTGCSMEDLFGNRVQKGDKGSISQELRQKKETTSEISGTVFIDPQIHPELRSSPPLDITIGEKTLRIPSNAVVKLNVGVKEDVDEDTINKLFTSWKANSAPVQLFIFGSILVAVGVGLFWIGMARIGIASGIMGITLIGCGILINSYPWVVLIVIGLGLVGGVYFIFNQYKKKSIEGENQDTFLTVKKLCELITSLPNDILDEYIKKPLKEDDKSALFRKITREARDKEN